MTLPEDAAMPGCTSRNNVVCHGIPRRNEVLQAGDIINVDVTTCLDGFLGDVGAAIEELARQEGCSVVREFACVSLAQIEYFVAVAQEGHVGRAAEKLCIALPAVSRPIRRLEDELRAPLFLRTPKGMCLSGAGAVFLQHAREILGGVSAARDAVLRAAATTPSPRRAMPPRD